MSRIAVLTGGVGGAKLVLGLCHAMPATDVVAIVNTGDDFEHLGLRVSPDIDTLLYTLAGKANAVQGWGREGETWSFMAALRSLGGEDWFNLGDGDLALHVLRTQALARGEVLSDVTRRVAAAWEIGAAVLPMSDDPGAVAALLLRGSAPAASVAYDWFALCLRTGPPPSIGVCAGSCRSGPDTAITATPWSRPARRWTGCGRPSWRRRTGGTSSCCRTCAPIPRSSGPCPRAGRPSTPRRRSARS